MDIRALIDAYEYAVSEHGLNSPSAEALRELIRVACS